MLKIAVIEDELLDLIQVVVNIMLFDSKDQQIQIIPILLSQDAEAGIKQGVKSFFTDFEDLKSYESKFPSINRLGPLEPESNQAHLHQILNLLKNEGVNLIISDISMGGDRAGIVLLEEAMSELWQANHWSCWAMTRFPEIRDDMLDKRWTGKFDPRAYNLNKKKIIASLGSGVCEEKLKGVIEESVACHKKIAQLKNQNVNELYGLIGQSDAMYEIYFLIEKVAAIDTTILIQGESGTGKELIARAIHNNSLRAFKSFVGVNCGAFTETLLETELFGYVKDAHNMAHKDKKGLWEEADNGTLFLDEIGETSPAMQVKLLRALQEGEIRRVGDTKTTKVDTRIIAATNRNLEEEVKKGNFRNDLLYRLNVIEILAPPLRKRRDDIPLLTKHFIKKYNQKNKASVKMDELELERLKNYPYEWTLNNVRELENRVESASTLKKDTLLIAEDLIPKTHQIELSNPDLSPEQIMHLIIQKSLRNADGIVMNLSEIKLRYGELKFLAVKELLKAWTLAKFRTRNLNNDLAREYFNMNANSYKVFLSR